MLPPAGLDVLYRLAQVSYSYQLAGDGIIFAGDDDITIIAFQQVDQIFQRIEFAPRADGGTPKQPFGSSVLAARMRA